MDGDRTFQKQLAWLLDPTKSNMEHVRMSNFPKKFEYTEEESSEKACLDLILSPRLAKARRLSLLQECDDFKDNNARQYSESVRVKAGLRSVARRAAVMTAEAGLQEAQDEYSTYSAPAETVYAGLKHVCDSFDNEGTSRSKSPRNGYVERDNISETVVEDLKVMEDQEVFDDDDGDEVNSGETVDEEDDESIGDLSNELVELIGKSAGLPSSDQDPLSCCSR
ncbi:MAG: hypothetical protein J3R72DRAFT_240757 [Linnemannia gamsii]|nr:MAG: hypothetical protein J3R72DRAFT_240757 [Linnemannia gamsii]